MKSSQIDVVYSIFRFGRPLLNFAAVLTILIMIVGIFGNALTVVALLKCPKVRNVAAAFIIRYIVVTVRLSFRCFYAMCQPFGHSAGMECVLIFQLRFLLLIYSIYVYLFFTFLSFRCCSLCVADCLFCAFVLPFNAFRFIQGTWTHGDFLCRLVPFMQYGNVGVSLLCIAMITINR